MLKLVCIIFEIICIASIFLFCWQGLNCILWKFRKIYIEDADAVKRMYIIMITALLMALICIGILFIVK